LFPGVSVNLSRSGVSTSIGVKGAHITVGHGQVRETVGFPGSGISFTTVHKTHGEAPGAEHAPPVTERSLKGRAWRGWLWVLLILLIGGALVSWLAGCDLPPAESARERETKDKIADANMSPATSCASDKMDEQRLNVLAWVDESAVCQTLQGALGRPPPISSIRQLSKAISLMQMNGSSDSAKELAYQITNVLEARGQLEDPKVFANSVEVVWKVFAGSQGHVTPKDLNILLRSEGIDAPKLSDDGVFRLSAVIWEEKKARGE
jgi:hypothetical protein